MGIQLSARIAVMESDEGPMVCLRKDPRRAPYRQGAGPDEKSRTKVRITKSEISMRTWRSPMSAASQGAFVVIPEISHSDISYITKKIKTVRFRSAEGARAYRLNGAPRAAVHFTGSCVCFVRRIRRLDCRLRLQTLQQSVRQHHQHKVFRLRMLLQY